jgi:MFS family permease
MVGPDEGGGADGHARDSAVDAPFLPVGAALFCIQLDFFLLAFALPSIARDLHSTTTDLQ